jgi:hypothetical protein
MIDIPVKAEVHCSDGGAWHSTYVIVNPINHLITHLVVKRDWPPFQEHVVPVDQVEETTPNLIKLKCTQDDLEKMEPFEYEEYIRTKLSDFVRRRDDYLIWPYVVHPPGFVSENTPPGELAVHRGAKVEATDGPLGQVDELLINSNNMHVTHLIMRERHVLKQREVAIPVSQIGHVEEDRVYLKLDKKSVEELPTVPVQRWSL